jgi:HEAT repeat protein
MIKQGVRWIVERPWVRMGLAVVLLIIGLASVGAPVLSDNTLRRALATGTAPAVAPTYTFRFSNQPDGTAQIQRSAGSSQNWAKVAALPEAVQQLVATGRNGQQAVYARTNDAIWRSQDAGANWAKAQGLPGKPLSLAASQETSGILAAGTAESGLFLSNDGGDSWRSAGGSLAIAGPGSLAVPAVAFNPADEQMIYATAEMLIPTPEGSHSSQYAFVSPDGGRRWFQMQGAGVAGTPAASATASAVSGGQILPTAGQPLAITLAGKDGAQKFTVTNAQGLVSGLDDPDPVTRAATARMIGLSGQHDLAPALMQDLRDGDLAAGQQVAVALGRLGNTAVAPDLMKALQDRDEAVRGRAALALGQLKYEAAVPELGRMLQNDGPLARGQAAAGLAVIGSPAAVAALMPPLGDAQMTAGRQAAMQALEDVGQPAVSQLTAALQSANDVIRVNAAETLGWIRSPEAVASLSQALRDQSTDVRSQAAWALGQIGTAPAQQALAQAMTGVQDQATRQAAGQALAQAQRTNAERSAVVVTPLTALGSALTQIPASRWTLLFLVVALSAVLLAIKPGPGQHLRRAGDTPWHA